MKRSRKVLVGGISVLLLSASTAFAVGAHAGEEPAADSTDPAQALLVDRVPTPKLDWYRCNGSAECATVDLPLDYRKPDGPTTEIAVLRVKAKDQAKKIGTLFVNPGGPGLSATDMALSAPQWLSKKVLSRFDVVGFDPRGLPFSDEVKCFRDNKEKTEKLGDGLEVSFPWGEKEENAYVASARELGKACSSTGKPLSGSMSTAQVARDMEVLRRAVGDEKLNFLGLSYGTVVGQYYANMFPDRFRAIAVDGVLNPVDWVGAAQGENRTLDDRLKSAQAAHKALTEIFRRCDAAGPERCSRAGHLADDFDKIVQRLRERPMPVRGEDWEYQYLASMYVGEAVSELAQPGAADGIESLTEFWTGLVFPETLDQRKPGREERTTDAAEIRSRATKAAFGFPYENGDEMNASVLCTDGTHPADAAQWPAMTARADERAPYFGRFWGWHDAVCATNTWTVADETAYRGPFNRRTAAPVLFVGNYWDANTPYEGAVSSAAQLPNSRLLSSDSWGHTAYGTSACATGGVDEYLLSGALPAEGTVCTGDKQPFAPGKDDEDADLSIRTKRVPLDRAEIGKLPAPGSAGPTMLPPVAPLV